MKILTLNYEYPPIGGGAAPVTQQICRHLAKRGHLVDLVTMHYRGLPAFENDNGVRIYRTSAIRKKQNICHTHEMISFLLCAWPKTLKLIEQNKYDIIHCHFNIPTGPLALLAHKITKIPYIITFHGSDVPGHNPDRFKRLHQLAKPLHKTICKNAASLTSPSLYLKNLIQKNIGPYTIRHIPNGINLDAFNIDTTKPKENIILATGRLLKIKGFHTLINAVHDVRLPFEVHIAGDGVYRKHLEQLAQGSKTKIVFHGWLEPYSAPLLDLYQKASIFTLLSSHENASIALLEGMAAKCAVITTSSTGCPETVADAGLLINYNDANALKEILIKLADDKALMTQYAEKALERLKLFYLWPNIIDQYLALYETCLSKPV